MRRPDGGRWAGLWEFPHAECEPLEAAPAAAQRLLAALGLRGEVRGELATIRHAVTRFRITLTCLLSRWRSGEIAAASYPEARWLQATELASYPISAPQRRLAHRLAAAD